VNLWRENLIILTDLPKYFHRFLEKLRSNRSYKTLLSFHTSICLHGENAIFQNNFTILTIKTCQNRKGQC